MNRLDLSLLGPPEVRSHGQHLSFATRKVLALLLYLAVEGGQHPREQITDLFWPDSDSAHGRAALRRTLVLLRQALPDADSILLVERERLGLNPASDFSLDLRVLYAAMRAGPAREALAQLQAAARAYRGDFLTGFSLADAPAFDEWASLQREYWHRQMESVLDWLSQLHAESGTTGEAIDVAARWVTHSPLNEAAHRRLMMCFFQAGNRTSALQAYEACRVLLRDELGVGPAPETEALAERIRAEVKPRQAGHPPSAPATPAELESPFVGRVAEFGQLVEAYHAAAQGQPRVVVLEGEAGIGKTRLAAEFHAWAKAQGARVLKGRAFEAGGRVPYQPIVEALRSARPSLSTVGLSPTWLAELIPLLPELREVQPELKPVSAGNDTVASTRLLEAVARLTQAIAMASPLIFFVDDAQWADAASLDAMRYAVRRWGENGTPAMLLITLRDESPAPPLNEWLADVAREGNVTRLTLNALTAADTLRWVWAITGGAQDEPGSSVTPSEEQSPVGHLSQWLFSATGGQPFFMVEILKTLVERGLLAVSAANGVSMGGMAVTPRVSVLADDLRRATHLPRSVQAMIRVRLARLTPPVLALLTAGAVLGHDFRFEDACAVAGLKEDEGLSALDELRRSRLLGAGGREGPADRLMITHDQIRSVVYEEAGEERRRVYHRRALETPAAAAMPPGELAYHALAAGLTEPAFRYSVAAGDGAMRVFAVRGAIRHYEQARALASTLQLPIPQLQTLHLQLGRAYELVSDFASARTVYEALLAVARESQRPEAECVALNRLATLAAQVEIDYEQALARLREALEITGRCGDAAGLAETEWNLAQIHHYMGSPESLPHGERALSLGRGLGQAELLARCLNTLAWAKSSFEGNWAQAEAHALEARALYTSLGNRAMEADCLCALVNIHLYLGRLQVAMVAAREAQAISLDIENPWGQAHSAFQVAKCALEAGDYEEALAQARQGAALAQAHTMPFLSVLCLGLQGVIERVLGMFDIALRTHLAVAELVRGLPMPQDLSVMVTTELTADHAAAGDWQGAWSEAQPLKQVTLAFKRSLPYNLWLSCDLLVEAFLRAGEVNVASTFVGLLGEHVLGSPRSRICHLNAMALLDVWRGNLGQAIDHLREAAKLAEAIGLPGELWRIDTTLGELYRRQEDEAAAQVFVSQASAIGQALAEKIRDEQAREDYLRGLNTRRAQPTA